MLDFLSLIFILMFFLISVAFFTIMERKILGIFHIRLGPNKIGLMGLFQPMSDALKLFLKNKFYLYKILSFMWNISPLILMFLLILFLSFLPVKNGVFQIKNMMLFIVCILSLSVFPFIFSSYFSYSKFSIIGSQRCISQMLSYEIPLFFIFFMILIFSKNMNLDHMFIMFNSNFSLSKLMFILMFILILCETGRNPFDFLEGESELISGFNTEFWGAYFSMFFIYEYGMMIFFSILICKLFFNLFWMFFLFISLYLFILIRSSFPRIRYDQMMEFCWKFMICLSMMMMIIIFKNLNFNLF